MQLAMNVALRPEPLCPTYSRAYDVMGWEW